MADRVKYFLLGLLFLVVAGVIAYDRWNSRESLGETEVADHERANSGEIFIGPNRDAPNRDAPNGGDDASGSDANGGDERDPNTLVINPNPQPDPKPVDRTRIDPLPDRIKPKPGPAARERVHVVKSGEALEKISRQYYPGKVYKGIELIVTANGLRNANVISEGQKLVIPAMDARPTRRPVVVDSKKPKPVKKPASGVPSVYVVKSSDGDLYKICRRFYGRGGEGARVSRIMEANNLSSVNLKAGTRLKLPKK